MTILLAVSAWAGPEPVPPRTFGDWVVGCDNGGRCRAVAGHADGPGPILILEREPGPSTTVGLSVVDPDQDRVATALRVDGKLVPVDLQPVRADPDRVAAVGTDLVRDLANAHRIELLAGDAVFGEAASSGAAAALRWMDEAQGRAGTTSAILARGAAVEVPAPAALPTVRGVPAPAGCAEHGLAPAAAKAAQTALGCWEGREPGVRSVRSWPLDPKRTLVLLSCVGGAYDVSDVALVVTADGAWKAAEFDFPPARVDDVSAPLVTNGDFLAETALLTSYARGRGIGDCGVSSTWAWDGTRFRLQARSEMPTCAGSTTWIPTWRCSAGGP